MRTLFIVRHGNTFAPGETARRIGARTDLPLVASGIAQAGAIGRHFQAAGITFEQAFVSPLSRTRETAAAIIAHQSAPPPIEIAGWLAEIDHGPDEALPDDAIIARIGADALARWDEDGDPPPGWQVDRAGRIAGWQALFADQAGRPPGNILIVTSNGAARFALLADAALRQAACLASLKLRTGAWGVITIEGDGLPRLLEWDRRP